NRPPAFRYAFLAVGALHSILVIWVAFHIPQVFSRGIVDGHNIVSTHQPWNWFLLLSSFLVLTFAVHGTVQRRREGEDAVGDFSLGVVIPSVVLLIMTVIAGAKNDADQMTIIMLLFCGLAIFFNRGRPIFMAIIVLSAFLMIFLEDARGGRVITQERS